MTDENSPRLLSESDLARMDEVTKAINDFLETRLFDTESLVRNHQRVIEELKNLEEGFPEHSARAKMYFSPQMNSGATAELNPFEAEFFNVFTDSLYFQTAESAADSIWSARAIDYDLNSIRAYGDSTLEDLEEEYASGQC